MKGSHKNFNRTLSPKYIINNICIVKILTIFFNSSVFVFFFRLRGCKRFKLCFQKEKRFNNIKSFTRPCLVIENNELFISTVNSRWTLLLNHSSIFLIEGPSSYTCFVTKGPCVILVLLFISFVPHHSCLMFTRDDCGANIALWRTQPLYRFQQI